MAQSAEGRALALGLLAGIGIGAAGVTLAVAWYRRTKKSNGNTSGMRTLTAFHNDLKASGSGAEGQLLRQQTDILEKLNGLIRSVEEVKSEVKTLKYTVPRLEERVRKELNQAAPDRSPRRRTSPLAPRKRKRSEPGPEDGDAAGGGYGSLSSEEVESEGGYITAHTDTEEESEEEKVIHSTVNTAFGSSVKDVHEDNQISEFDALMQKADNLHGSLELDRKEGFRLLLENKDQYWDQVEFLWRLARAYGDMHDITSDKEDKKNYAIIGKEIAMDAVNLSPQSADSHMWLSIICGYLSEYGSVQTKIKNGCLFKDHIDKAIELKPQDPKLYYLLGRWCYSSSQLSWIERKVAATLFEEPPNSTIQDALQCFLKVEEIHPRYSKANSVYLTKCYRELGQMTNAQMWCDMAASFPDNVEEQETQEELENLRSLLKQ